MIGKWVAILLLAVPAGIGAQQPSPAKPDQQQSQARDQEQDPLAAAARRAREQQKNRPPASKVWDNDNLPTAPSAVSVVGGNSVAASGESSGNSSGGQGSAESGKAASTADRKAELQKQLDDAKARLKSAQTDLDIATRTYQLDQQTFYSNPNHDSDTAGATKLKSEQSDADAKKQDVETAQKRVDELTAKLQDLEKAPAKTSTSTQ